MTPKSDESGKCATLPAPELNPLLNPILNRNLGRWAEVYFTNPPEKRDQAVLHLLRELESAETDDTAVPSLQARNRLQRPAITRSHAHAVICGGCGFENEAQQRFCGDCGVQLAAAVASTTPEKTMPAEREPHATYREASDRGPQFGSILHLSDPDRPGSRQHEGSSNRLEKEDDAPGLSSGKQADSARLGLSYRILIGAALAVIIGSLAYMAWRGGQAAPERSRLPELTPSTATNQANPAPPVPQTSSSPQSANGAAPAAESNAKPENAAPPPLPENRSTTSSASGSLPANGNQDLAQALDLLNGVGEERDSTQAAELLWKAVEKKNTHATVLLAGLYLRGDGVEKNCDQGRILLDAAADKGSKDAAALLQNLPAFGCQ